MVSFTKLISFLITFSFNKSFTVEASEPVVVKIESAPNPNKIFSPTRKAENTRYPVNSLENDEYMKDNLMRKYASIPEINPEPDFVPY